MSQPPELTEEQLRQLEAEMERITVDDVLLQTIVTLLNLGARKAGLARRPARTARRPTCEQMRQAIEGARALLPLLEQRHGDQLGPVRDTLSQLQMAYAQQRRAARRRRGRRRAARRRRPASRPKPEGPGPAQRSGRLWVPGQ